MKTLQMIFIGLVIAVVLGGAAFFLFDRYTTGTLVPNENALTASKDAPETTTTAAVANIPASFTWELIDVTKASDTNSSTQVHLVTGGKTYALGTYEGSCKEIAAGETGVLGEKGDADELSPRVQCWFAGGGDEIGLFKDGAGYSVKVGELEEGIEGAPAFRGNFKSTIAL